MSSTSTSSSSSDALNASMSDSSSPDDESSDVQVFVLTAIFVAIVVGNVPIVITIVFGKLGKTRMYYFLLHLCIADLITGFFNVIPQIIWEITRTFHGGNVLCKSIKYLQILGLYLSSFTLTAMSIDRFLAICHPLTNNHLSLYRAKRSLTIAWSLSIVFCLPQLFIFSYTTIDDGTMECWGSFPYPPWGIRLYVTWYAVSSFIVPFSIIFYTNARICCELWKNSRERRLTSGQRLQCKNGNSNLYPKRIFRFSKPNKSTTNNSVTVNTRQINSSSSATSVDVIPGDTESVASGARPVSLFNCEINTQSTAEETTGDAAPKPVSILSRKKCKQLQVNLTPSETPNSGNSSRFHSLFKRKKRGTSDDKCADSICISNNSSRNADCDINLPSSPSQTEFRVHRGGYNAGTSNSRSSHVNKKVSMSSVDFVHRDDNTGEINASHCRSRDGNRGECAGAGGGGDGETQQLQPPSNHTNRLSFLSFLNTSSSDTGNRPETASSSCYNSPSMLRFNRCISQEDEHLRAKIKSVKLTVTVILCYVICSLPFIFVQLWAHWYPGAQESASWTGPMVTIVMRMSSLNSCVNPWIYLTFNQKLYKALKKLFLCSSSESEGQRYSGDVRSC